MELNLNINLNKLFSIKNVSYVSIVLNLASIILGFVYIITISFYNIFWDILGIIYLISLFSNFLLVFLDSIRLNKKNKLGRRLSIIGYLYLITTTLAMIGMLAGNLLISINYSSDFIANLKSYMMIWISYFGLLIFGIIISYFNIKNLNNTKLWEQIEKRTSLVIKILKIILMLFCYFFLLIGIFFVIITLLGAETGVISGAIGLIVAEFDLFFVFIFLSITVFVLKLKDRKKSPISFYAVVIIGIFISGVFMAPLCLTPYSVYSADKSFTDAFGSNWKSKIPTYVENTYFLKTPFSIPEYFLGMITNNYEVIEDIQFYDAEGINLCFDVYMPKVNGSNLPGNNSVIIKIHGGGWTQGDKGLADMMQVNKYLAAQGYVIFDIQYGLYDSGSEYLPTDEEVLGNFDIDDMVRHIGNFTRFLAIHSDNYSANLDSVFVSGGSAGGHLTCATALGIDNGSYSTIFGDNLTIKGYIPFYPANGHSEYKNITGAIEFVHPDDYLIKSDSPPCLIFQGTGDGLVHPSISQHLKDMYNAKGNDECAIIWLPLAGHANDLYFSGYYNQVFLFYMERFLYLCVNDLI